MYPSYRRGEGRVVRRRARTRSSETVPAAGGFPFSFGAAALRTGLFFPIATRRRPGLPVGPCTCPSDRRSGLNTRAAGRESTASAMKYPLRTNWNRSPDGVFARPGLEEASLQGLHGAGSRKSWTAFPSPASSGWNREQAAVQAHLGPDRVTARDPLDGRGFSCASPPASCPATRVVAAAELDYIARSGILDGLVAPDDVGVAKPDFPARAQPHPVGRRILPEVGAFDHDLAGERQPSRPFFGMSCGQYGASSHSTLPEGQFVIATFSGRRTAMTRGARALRSSRIASSRRSMLTRLFVLSTPMRDAKEPDPLRGVPPAAHPGDRRHARVVPAGT